MATSKKNIVPAKTAAEVEAETADFSTTFNMDFAIAENFGLPAVQDTFRRAFNEWKSDYRYLTDLVLVLNRRCWLHHNNHNEELSKYYADRYYEARDYALDNLRGAEVDYYFQMTD